MTLTRSVVFFTLLAAATIARAGDVNLTVDLGYSTYQGIDDNNGISHVCANSRTNFTGFQGEGKLRYCLGRRPLMLVMHALEIASLLLLQLQNLLTVPC